MGETNQYKINNVHNDFIGIGKCGNDSVVDIQRGRYKGGLGILFNKNLGNKIKQVACEHKRIIAMTLILEKESVLLLNVYFPNDTHSNTNISHELIDICNTIE